MHTGSVLALLRDAGVDGTVSYAVGYDVDGTTVPASALASDNGVAGSIDFVGASSLAVGFDVALVGNDYGARDGPIRDQAPDLGRSGLPGNRPATSVGRTGGWRRPRRSRRRSRWRRPRGRRRTPADGRGARQPRGHDRRVAGRQPARDRRDRRRWQRDADASATGLAHATLVRCAPRGSRRCREARAHRCRLCLRRKQRGTRPRVPLLAWLAGRAHRMPSPLPIHGRSSCSTTARQS